MADLAKRIAEVREAAQTARSNAAVADAARAQAEASVTAAAGKLQADFQVATLTEARELEAALTKEIETALGVIEPQLGGASD